MNTPPESATVSMPSCTQISLAMRAEERATATMEIECEPVGGRSGFNSSQKCLKERFLVQNIGAVQPRWARCEIAGVVVGKMGDFVVERAPGGGFEFYGGFALVGCLVADVQNCCRGIKETPHAAGTRAVDAALDHGGCHAARLLVEAVQKPSRRLGARADRAH